MQLLIKGLTKQEKLDFKELAYLRRTNQTELARILIRTELSKAKLSGELKEKQKS